MKKVIITKGLPASGKSTWVKQFIKENPESYKRINKDDLREMLDGGIFSRKNEDFILKVRDILILEFLKNDYNVIVDDTNLATKHEIRIKNLVNGLAEVEIKDFTDVSIETCIERDLKRFASVGESVIRGMHKQFLMEKSVYQENITLPKAIIVDIDGTLAKMKDRSPFDWDKVGNDECNETIKKIVNSYNNKVIIFSGRDSICRAETIKWLNNNKIKFDWLFMREHGNNEKDAIIKRRLFEDNIRGKYYIEYILDDRNQVVEMWRNLGLTCLQVAEGNF